MAVTSIERRLAKLEARQPTGLAVLMDDELLVTQLDIWRRLAARVDLTADERAAADREAARIEAQIGASVAQRSTSEYQRHLDYCRQVWAQRSDQAYVPALICGLNGMGEYDGWDKPHVMTSRAEMHGRFATGVVG
jgi:hypothetical protein